MDKKLQRKTLISIFIGVIILAYVIYLCFSFPQSILYLGEPPFEWTEDPSFGFSDLLMTMGAVTALGICVQAASLLYHKQLNTGHLMVATTAALILGITGSGYGIFKMIKFGSCTLYRGEEPFLRNGEIYQVNDFLPILIVLSLLMFIFEFSQVWTIYKKYRKK